MLNPGKNSPSASRKIIWCISGIILARFGVSDIGDLVSDRIDFTGLQKELHSPESLPKAATTLVDTVEALSNGEDKQDISICLLLIVRNEEDSLRENLPLWREVADNYVIGVDDRTTDGTVEVLREVLEDKPRFIFLFTFEDFSQARNTVLRSATQNFPNASHVLIADADWRPDLATVDFSELDLDHAAFHFLLWDHSGHTSRRVWWLLRNDQRIRFKYRVHEALDTDVLNIAPTKLIGWEVRIVESKTNWHADVHGSSRTAERFLFDIKLLELDYEDDPISLHTLFYLGITTFSYLEELVGKGVHNKTPELEALVNSGMFYFNRVIELYGDLPGLEFVWSSIRWLGYGFQYFASDSEEAKRWYQKCIAYDPDRIDCVISLSRLNSDNGNLDEAWDQAKLGLLYHCPKHLPLNFFYIYECFVPVQAATVISKRVVANSFGEDSLSSLLTLGRYLLQHQRDHCKHGVIVDTVEDIDRLNSWFEAAVQREGVDVVEMKRLSLASDEVSFLQKALKTWGTAKKAVAYYEPDLASLREISTTVEDPAEGIVVGFPNASEEEKYVSSKSTLEWSHETDALTTLTKKSLPATICAEIVQEARDIISLDSQSKEGPGTSKHSLMAATNLVQIIGAMTTSARPWSRHATGQFRALIFGGGGGGEGGLEHEELRRVLFLLVQLFSSPYPFDVTYAHPDLPTLENTRAIIAQCLDDINMAGSSLRFVHSTFNDFLDTDIEQTFDYVDVGGPLAYSSKRDDVNGVINRRVTIEFDPANLQRLGTKLTPGACIRLWTFAANPSTRVVFRASSNKATRNNERKAGVNTITDASLGKVLRRAFGIGNKERGPLTAFLGSGTNVTGEEFNATAEASADVGIKWIQPVEVVWARQILAGGDRLSIVEIDEVLSDSGFELVLMLGEDSGRYKPAGTENNQRLEDIAELLDESVSRWEMADVTDAFDSTPSLIHQALAVWRG